MTESLARRRLGDVLSGAGHGEIAVKRGEENLWSTETVRDLVVGFLGRTIGASAAP